MARRTKAEKTQATEATDAGDGAVATLNEQAPRSSGPVRASDEQRAALRQAMKDNPEAAKDVERESEAVEGEHWKKREDKDEKKGAKAEKDEAPEKDEDEGEGEPVEAADHDAETVEHRRARAAIERSGAFTKEELDAMSPEELLRRGTPLHRKWQEYDRAVSTKRREPADGESELKADPTVLVDAKPAPAKKLGTDLEPLLVKLVEKVGDDVGAELRAVIEAVDQRSQERAQGLENEQLERDMLHGQRIVMSTRQRLAERIPELADDAAFRTVQRLMKKLSGNEELEGLESNPDDYLEALMLQSARAAGLREVTPEDRSEGSEKAERMRRARRNGHPASTSRRTAPTSFRDQQRSVLRHLVDGGDVDGARRAAGL